MAAFLKAELDSPTEGGRLRATLMRLGVKERIITDPHPGHDGEDMTRWSVFEHYRGQETLFETLDLRELEWIKANLTEHDLRYRTKTCRHGFENRYGTRDPSKIAAVLNEECAPNGVLARVRNGEVLEPPLLVATPRLDLFVILEGHNRIISYLRGTTARAFPMVAFIGFSENVARWREWA
jgi:hypothetical protein